jgi:hypothetical protein
MSPARSAEPGPGLMWMPAPPSRGFMEPDPGAPPFEWSRDGLTFLWLVAFVLALVLEVELAVHGGTS